jgi:hypothetical protein
VQVLIGFEGPSSGRPYFYTGTGVVKPRTAARIARNTIMIAVNHHLDSDAYSTLIAREDMGFFISELLDAIILGRQTHRQT